MCVAKTVRALRRHKVECAVLTSIDYENKWKKDNSGIWRDVTETSFVHYLTPPHSVKKRKLATLIVRLKYRYLNACWWIHDSNKVFQDLARMRPYECIMARAGSENSIISAWHMSRKSKTPFIAILNDPRPMSLLPPPYDHRTSFISEFMKKREMRLALCDASMVIFPSRRLAQYMEQKLRVTFRNTVIIPHIGYAAPSQIVSPDPIVLLHAGTIDPERDAGVFLKGFARALAATEGKRPDVQLVFLGEIAPKGIAMIKQLGLARYVTCRDAVSYEQSLVEMQKVHALVLIEAIVDNGIFLPAKLCDYAMAKKPLLLFSPKMGTVVDIVGHVHPGFLGQSEGQVALKLETFINSIVNKSNLDSYLCPDGMQFGEDRIAERYIECLQSVLRERGL
ncbi:MAG: glycosyltransferase family 4 protein [Colwellia sp.]|nr:glycosyltransferase family 4 protein [Colwellia sp.]